MTSGRRIYNFCFSIFLCGAVGAQQTRPATSQATQGFGTTVAVLDFEMPAKSDSDVGRQTADIISASLCGLPNVTLVERAALSRLLSEQGLNLSGAIDAAKAIQIGKIAGARVLITGRVISPTTTPLITAKVISSETSRVFVAQQQCESAAEIDASVIKLAGQVAQILRDKSAELLPPDDQSAAVLDAARSALLKKKLPVVAVLIREEHLRARPAQPPDPAVETEVKKLLREAGFTIRDIPGNSLNEWAPSNRDHKLPDWPKSLDGVDALIIGEAFSEYGGQIGHLASCSARAEINLIRRETGVIELADRTTARGVDLAEHVAGKTALEKCGQTLGLRLLEQFAKSLPTK